MNRNIIKSVISEFSFSITGKLLVIILPLVCIPVVVIGYFSYTASIERVTEMSKNELMMQAENEAAHINSIFESCRMDLQTMAWLPIIEDYYYIKLYNLEAEAEDSRIKIETLFSHFLKRSLYYDRIRFIDLHGDEIVTVQSDEKQSHENRIRPSNVKNDDYFREAINLGRNRIYTSDIHYDIINKRYIINLSIPYINIWEEFAGVVVLDLDYDRLIKHINTIPIQAPGYAFILDQLGRTIAHPKFRPYEDDLKFSPDEDLREIRRKMVGGQRGWHTYTYEPYSEKIAAFTPIPVTGWSLAVSLPMSKLKEEALLIREKIFKMVILILFTVTLIVSFFSYRSLRPIRTMVSATEAVASGDLDLEIPVNSRDELGKLSLAFNRMTKRLKKVQQELIRSEKLVSMGRLSAGVAHEFRNPLNTMKGALFFIKRKRSGDELVCEYTELMLEEIERLNKFVTEFLSFAKQSSPALSRFDLNNQIHGMLKKFGENFQVEKIEVRTALSEEMPEIMADREQIEQVLYNVIINAIHAMSEGGILTISTYVDTGETCGVMACITIEDNGAGIAQEHLQSIFDPFFSTKDNGTGLGLPISLGIVESHNGQFTISSREGQGTAVHIRLPLECESAALDV